MMGNRSKVLALLIGLFTVLSLGSCGVGNGIVSDANFSEPLSGFPGVNSAQPSLDDAGIDQQEPVPVDIDDDPAGNLVFDSPDDDPDPSPDGNGWPLMDDKASN